MHLPIRTRLTLVFAGLMLAVLVGLGAFLYLGLAHQLDTVIDDELNSLSREFAADVAAGEDKILADFGITEPEGSFAQILDRDGRVIDHSHAVDAPLLNPAELRSLTVPLLIERSVQLRSGLDTARILAAATPEGPIVVIGMVLEERNAALESLATLLAIAGPVLLMIVSCGAWFLSGAALRPVEQIRQEASAISVGDLEKRLRVPASGDEIANLATTLNEMLARLQQAFERERRFVDDASHELRTPLGILKTELELALRRSRTKEELEAALASAAEESERLNRLAEDLLVLARSDRGSLPLKRMKIDLPILVQKTVGSFTGQACDNEIEIAISVPPDLIVAADELRLQQALGNLMVNALSHTPRGGCISVSAATDPSRHLILSVADSGAGFPDKFVERAFDRFTRADTGRSRRAGGAGLGLAIVKSIVEAHGGLVTAGNRPEGGAIVVLSIPV